MRTIVITIVFVLSTYNYLFSQEFAEKRILINNLNATLDNNGSQKVEDVVYVKEFYDELHFISHINDEMVLYRMQDNEVTKIDSLGALSGFIVDTYDHNSDGLIDIISHFGVRLAVSESEFDQISYLSPDPMSGRIFRTGDYDSDGNIDILTKRVEFIGAQWTETIYLYYLDSDNNIKAESSIFSGYQIHNIQTADLNNDGLPDIVYTQDDFGDNLLVAQINNGDGTFDEQIINIHDTGEPLLIGDFNGDTYLDIVITGFNGKDLEILINDSGVLQSDSEILTSERIYCVKAGDINNDSILDLVYLENGNFDNIEVNYSLGIGDGSFGDPNLIGKIEFDGLTSSNSFAQASENLVNLNDYNNDGDLDIFVSAIYEQTFVLFENLGVNTSSLATNELTSITLGPNPATNSIKVSSDIDIEQVCVIDATGNLVLQEKLKKEIDIQHLSSGLYIARVLTSNGKINLFRFVKN